MARAVRRHEWPAAIASAAWLFCVLASYYVLKPIRGVVLQTRIGVDHKSVAILLTTVFVAAQAQLVGSLSRRLGRRRLVGGTLAASLGVLGIFAVALDRVRGAWVGYAFYAWVSRFSLLAISQFWSFATDVWSHEDGLRLFGGIGVGAVAGGVAGNLLAVSLGRSLSGGGMLAVAAGLLALATVVAAALLRWADARRASRGNEVREPPRAAAALVLGSPYLAGIAAMSLLLNVVNTSNEWVLDKVVAASSLGAGEMQSFYGRYQLDQNVLTLVLQAFVVSPVRRRFGPRGALLVLPAVSVLGGLAFLAAPSLGAIRALKVAENAADYSVHANTRELLYVPVSAAEKYGAKTFNDTFVVRAGDSLAAGLIFAVGEGRSASGVAPLVLVGVALALLSAHVVRRVTASHQARLEARNRA